MLVDLADTPRRNCVTITARVIRSERCADLAMLDPLPDRHSKQTSELITLIKLRKFDKKRELNN